MVSPCYNLAAVSSSAACVQCGMAFCKDCLENGLYSCYRGVEARQ